MAKNSARITTISAMAGFYYFTLARFFAGLYFRSAKPILSGS